MKGKSLVSKFDTHLRGLDIHYHVSENIFVYKGYAYIDYETVEMGAIFFFLPIEKWVTQDYDEQTDLKEILVEFEPQYEILTNYNYAKGFIASEETEELTDQHDAFDTHEALKIAERKAFEYLNEQ
ncbi:hypothetical protein LZQ00_00655 [Sphingobacterium sp. SRCM116780]|uniref:hypothetical protein n=1 Tax=Sphingobacterium sp. SRCM116780 TaxID=2907623 RepID=UPI001F269B4D|nr:hypothetical protein [Sphingobacterium sp. SRCM116780]UIR56352.1 hypothetical protein LZQ00_00655 [Sphingobacterium sp. SRCM116780]